MRWHQRVRALRSMMPLTRLVLAVLTALALAACASSDAPGTAVPNAPTWLGRFALTITEPGVEQQRKQVQGRFVLRALDGRQHLEVFSPFGQTIAILQAQPGRAHLRMADGRELLSDSADALLEQALGWRLPVASLPDWLSSHPPETQAAEPKADSSWRIAIAQRFDDGRPRILDANWPARPAVGDRTIQVRIVVDSP